MNKHINMDLRKAKAEIKNIMDKYDCGGVVSLHNQTHTEFEIFFPKWSVAKLEKNKKGDVAVRIKHKVNKDPMEPLEATVHLIMDCKNVCENFSELLNLVAHKLEEHLQIDHKPFSERD